MKILLIMNLFYVFCPLKIQWVATQTCMVGQISEESNGTMTL